MQSMGSSLDPTIDGSSNHVNSTSSKGQANNTFVANVVQTVGDLFSYDLDMSFPACFFWWNANVRFHLFLGNSCQQFFL